MINGCQLLQKNNKLVIDKFVPTYYTERVDKKKTLNQNNRRNET
ncbi:hypothetical protein P869_08745 [Ligilactobacillus ruminis S23]|uniref:Uncharacterized protein n=1 Tax=Ligilactobacillus ruminis ATCC 25644 TaxID=525362 RepID=E7FS77_9LACO|nr:hypothetical protein HMPREF0542_11754 [Ligilactobacillus ruminis ATCC 25644]KLA47286.1 hypothetical protein P869_08745 [Ligilactobacillus ruminis S23]